MSQSPRRTLPEMQSTYAQSFRVMNRDQQQTRPVSRIDYIEDRLDKTEKTTQSLLDRAYKVKEDIIDNLNLTRGTWQEEKRARELLQEHVRTITEVVRKLDFDIKSIDDQIRNKENVVSGTSNAVKNLEVHHITGLTDLRGRVARCDAAIARLATDIKGFHDNLKVLQQSQSDNQSKVVDRLQLLDSKISDLALKLDKANTENTVKLKNIEGDSTQQVMLLDSKTRALLDEVKSQQNSVQLSEHAEREKLENRLLVHLDRATVQRDAKTEKLEHKIEDALLGTQKRIAKLEEDLLKEKSKSQTQSQVMESKLQQMLEVMMRQKDDHVEQLKRECREGFLTVHESIGNMKTVLDGKRKLLEDQLRKEIGTIRKMVKSGFCTFAPVFRKPQPRRFRLADKAISQV